VRSGVLRLPSAEGFRELPQRVRQAVLQSQRLVVLLDRLVLQGFRRRQSSDPLVPSDVEPAIQAVRTAVRSLAGTTPLKFSADYKGYTERVEALIKVGRAVLDRGVESSVKIAELDEWERGGEGLVRSSAPLVLPLLAGRWHRAVRAEGLVAGARRCLPRARVLA